MFNKVWMLVRHPNNYVVLFLQYTILYNNFLSIITGTFFLLTSPMYEKEIPAEFSFDETITLNDLK